MKSTNLLNIPNIKFFILFRVCYNCRFYYPIFTVLFLDYGLTLSQFAILNAVWAFTIVFAEVPSGAIADTIGRRILIKLSAVIMLIELSLLAFVPLGNSTLIFTVFLINRILSGLSSAFSSGADEALAYDSLKAVGREKEWPLVLQCLMRCSLGTSMAVTIIGASMYDLSIMQKIASFLNIPAPVAITDIMRFPLYATLIFGVIALYAAIKMTENSDVKKLAESSAPLNNSKPNTIKKSFNLTISAAKWIVATPIILMILCYQSLFEHSIRMIMTMSSQYYRAIEIPEVYFGVIGVFMILSRMVLVSQSRKLAETEKTFSFIALMGAIALFSFWLLGQGMPIWGVLPMLMLQFVSMSVELFTSYHLNLHTDSSHRATVLSFKGLLFNLSYGVIGILYALHFANISGRFPQEQVESNQAFLASLPIFTYYFAALFTVLSLFFYFRSKNHQQPATQIS